MMDIKKRIAAIEYRNEEKNRVPVIIVELQPDGRYLWNGNTYTQEELDRLQRKNKTAVIIDDVIGIARREMVIPKPLETATEYITRKGDQDNE